MTRELSIAIGEYPHSTPLFDGRVGSDAVRLRRMTGYDPIHEAFGDMVNDQAFDVSEMAIATYLQARAAGSPIIALPYSMVARFQHRFLVHDTRRPRPTADALAGARVGLRAYTVTTGMWVRGVMRDEFGLDSDDATWVTWEAPHVAGYENPANVQVLPARTTVSELLAGEAVDLGIDGADQPADGPVQPYIEDHAAAARDWFGRRGVLPINHLIVVRSELATAEPETVVEVGRMLAEARGFSTATEPLTGTDPLPSGVEAVAPILELAVEYAVQQHLIPAPLAVADLLLEV